MSCKVRLSDLISIKHGFAFKGEFFKDYPTSYILTTPGNFAIGGGFKNDKYKYYDGSIPIDYVLKENDLIVTMTDLSKQADTLGYSALVPNISGATLLHNQRIGLIEFHSDKIDKIYLYFLLRSPSYRHHVVSSATGSTVKHTSPTKILSFEFELPELGVQKLIAKNLLALEQKITLNRQINQTLEAMAQALFKSWFVDFEPVKAKMAALASGGNDEDANLAAMSAISSKTTEQLLVLKTDNPAQYQQLYDTAVLFPSEMVESELGEVPKGWEYGSVGEIAKAKGGYAFKSTDFSEQGFPVIKIKNITGNGIVEIEYNSCVVESATSKTARFRLNDGDLVMAMTGATVGKTGLINTFGNNIYLNQRVAVFESDTYGNKISWFLFCLFNTREAFQFVVGSALGSAQPNISSSGIEMTPTILPNSHVMECFLSKVDPLFNKWLKNNEESIFLSTLRDELLPKLLSGELLV